MRARWVGLICAVPLALGAQGASPAGVPLAPSLKAGVERLADSARALGLPTDPLFAKASEGTLKGADEQRIMLAVRRLARELSDAKAALGDGATADELEAGASALHAGVGVELIARLGRAARDGRSGNRSIGGPGGRAMPGRLVTPLVTLADMVARDVSPAAAVASIETLVNRGAADAQYVALRSDVERDIAAGERPDAAMQRRSASIAKRLDK